MNSEELNHEVSFYAKSNVGGFYCAAYCITMGHHDLILARIKTNENHPKGKCICMENEMNQERFYDINCNICHGSFMSDNLANITCSKCQNQDPGPGNENVEPINIIPDKLPDPNYNFGPTEKIFNILPELENQTFMSDEWKKSRRIKLFNDRNFHAKYLIGKKENGTYDYEKMIQYIQFLEECIKDLKTVQQAYMLAKTWHIENANAEERERIKEEDKKYKPQYKEREAKEKSEKKVSKKTQEENNAKEASEAIAKKYQISEPNARKIYNLTCMGIAEEVAKGIILGSK